MVPKLTAFVVLALAILTGSLLGQTTINQSDFILTPGTVYTASINSDIDTNLWAVYTSGSGGGHLWDFSSIPFTASAQTTVVNANTVPNYSMFPGATGAWAVAGLTSWSLFKSVPNQLYTLGTVSIGPYDPDPGIDTLVIVYDMPSLQVQFPVTSSSTWNSVWQWTTVYPAFSVVTRDSVKYIVDAWGTIKYGNKQASALRVRAEWTITQTTVFPGVPDQTNSFQLVMYQFMSKEYGSLSLNRTTSAQRTYVSAAADFRFTGAATPVYEVESPILPESFTLEQNYPNPFNPETSIPYSLPKAADVSFSVVNVLGQEVWNESFGTQSAGNYVIRWQGKDSNNQSLPSGVYFYRVSAGETTLSRKMLLLK